jgi:hypothetical protein
MESSVTLDLIRLQFISVTPHHPGTRNALLDS